jgi:DNA-binding MarR family transcriptional regulator
VNLKEQLANSLKYLNRMKGQCYVNIVDDIGLSDLSIKQISYLKEIGKTCGMTTSQLAESLNLSKPTVTEMVKKFMKNEFVYKVSCPNDGRVHYIKLTEKGQKIVDVDVLTNNYLANRLINKLSEDDVRTLIVILEKMG